MKTLEIEQDRADLKTCIDAAQMDRILLTRGGRPAAIVVGVAGYDLEQVELASDPEFWKMIEESRRQPTMSWEEMEAYLAASDKAKSLP